jgi:hypothetical protein
MPDGTTRTYAVGDEVDVTQRRPGEQISVRTTQPVAVSVNTNCDCPFAADSVLRTPKDYYNNR